MDWLRNKHVKRCQNCLTIITGLLIGLDAAAFWLCRWFTEVRSLPEHYLWLFLAVVYLVSIPAWICLAKLAKLLVNIRMGEVFVEENVRCMRSISLCCLAAAVLTAASTWFYLPFLFVAAAGLFMFLIVRIVADVFCDAIGMKDELDLTV